MIRVSQGVRITRFSCEVNTISEERVRYIWSSIGARAAIGRIRQSAECIYCYVEVPEQKKQYPEKFKSLIEERGIKVRGEINQCGSGNVGARAAYQSVENGEGIKFYYHPENFNMHVVRQAQHIQPFFDSEMEMQHEEAPIEDRPGDFVSSKVGKLLEIDMVPSAINPIGTKDQRRSHKQILSGAAFQGMCYTVLGCAI